MTVPTEAGGLTPEECPEADVAEFEHEFADTAGKTPLVIKLLVRRHLRGDPQRDDHDQRDPDG